MERAIPTLTRSQLAKVAVVVEGGMFLVAALIAWWVGISILDQLNVTWNHVALGVVASLLPLLVVLGVAESDTRFGEMSRRDFGPVIAMFRKATLFDIFYVSALAGLGEEALFRGLLQTGIASHVGVVAAIVIASLVFGLAHALSKSYFAFAALIGIYFGLLLVWTGSLLVPMIAHGLYDFIVLIYGTRFSKRFHAADEFHVE